MINILSFYQSKQIYTVTEYIILNCMNCKKVKQKLKISTDSSSNAADYIV